MKSPDEKHAQAYGSAIAAAILMGSLGLFVRHVNADASLIAFARLSLGFLFMAAFLAVTGNLRAVRFSFSPYLAASGIMLAICVWSYIEAISHTSLANAAFLLYLGPLIATGLAHPLLGEKLALPEALLIGLAFIGLLFLLQFDVSAAGAKGYGYGLLSALAYALAIVSNRKIPGHIPPLGRSFYQLLAASLVLCPLVAWQTLRLSMGELSWLLAIGFLQGFLGLTLMVFAIGHLKAHEFGVLSYLEPAVAAAIGVVAFGETLAPLQTAGGAIIVISGLSRILLSRKTHPVAS